MLDINFMLKNILKNKKGMAMIIVLTIAFIIMATIGAITTIVMSNLENLNGQTNSFKANNNIEVALEKLRGVYKADKKFFEKCSVDDCIVFNSIDNSGSCLPCNDPRVNLHINKYKVNLTDLVFPDPRGPNSGSIDLLVTGYYNNSLQKKNLTMCLNYCEATGYVCGDDGCGESCGSCPESQVCGGNGQPGVCSEQIPASCDNINAPCDVNCVEGDTCGGGRIIDAANHIIAYEPNCGRSSCDSSMLWSQNPGVTGATNTTDGRINMNQIPQDSGHEAAYYCSQATFNGFGDWYLPALNEIDIMGAAYQNGWSSGYYENCYWSSTELDENKAYAGGIGFLPFACNDGTEKNSSIYVRCLRRY